MRIYTTMNVLGQLSNLIFGDTGEYHSLGRSEDASLPVDSRETETLLDVLERIDQK